LNRFRLGTVVKKGDGCPIHRVISTSRRGKSRGEESESESDVSD
jgi:hypothetical protein